jgi:uroporphyrinogen-III synthase
MKRLDRIHRMDEATPARKDRPLLGARIVVTRPEKDAADLAAAIVRLGGVAFSVPVIRVVPPEDPSPLEEARRTLGTFDWVALTSRHAARALLAGAPVGGKAPRIAVVGDSTARSVDALGCRADLVAEGKGAEALAAAMIEAGAGGKTVLHPRSNLAGDELRLLLEEAGCTVRSLEAYRTLPPDDAGRRAILERMNDGNGAVFASPSAVHFFAGIARGARPALFDQWIAVAIGATTGAALDEAGFARITVAERPSDEGLLDALRKAWLCRAAGRRNEP